MVEVWVEGRGWVGVRRVLSQLDLQAETMGFRLETRKAFMVLTILRVL